MSKYYSQKVVVDGISFDSKKEANRFRELSLLERAGAITGLERQVKFTLIPAQYRPVFDKKTRKWKDRCVEGFKTKDYILKRKMMLYFHGITIKEV